MKNLDMVKFILFASIILCLAGVGLYFFQKYDLKNLEREVPLCQRKLTRVGELSVQVDLRRDELEADKRQGLKVSKYVEEQAYQAGIDYRNYLGWKPMSEVQNRTEGYVDCPYEITPEKKKKFTRKEIAKFIFNLENFTNRLKVTELFLDKPSDDREEWNMFMKITERTPLDK